MSDTDPGAEALAQAIDSVPASPPSTRGRGVTKEWALRIEDKLDELLRLQRQQAGIATVEQQPRVDERGGITRIEGQLDLDLDDDPEPMSAYDAMTSMRTTLSRRRS